MQKVAKFIGIVLTAGFVVWMLKTWYVFNFTGGAFGKSAILIQAFMVILPVAVVAAILRQIN
jgi:hypothetical protein